MTDLPQATESQTQPPEETIASQEKQITELRQGMAQLEQVVQEQKSSLEERQSEVNSLREKLTSVVGQYRATLLAGSPEVPEELVKGDSLEEIDSSFSQAREMVEKVKRKLEARLTNERVPAGAPIRARPDLTALSPREKIAYGLARR